MNFSQNTKFLLLYIFGQIDTHLLVDVKDPLGVGLDLIHLSIPYSRVQSFIYSRYLMAFLN